jgi:lipid-A-disaccharide synthase
MNPPSIYLSAGEASGDRIGARLAEALHAAEPELRLVGMGGPRMRTAGVELVQDATPCGAHGLAEVVGALPAHHRLLRAVQRGFTERRYRLAVFIDYPGFHLAAARAARQAGVRTLQYVAPQLWAWGAWRAGRVRRRLDRLAVILPFEEAFFRDRGVDARFVGHPLLDEPTSTRAESRARLGLSAGDRVLGLVPGSRRDEVARLWPVFRDAARRLSRELPDLVVLAAAMPELRYPDARGVRLVTGGADTVLAAADAALCKAGTSTLEAALAGTPHVVAYGVHPVTWQVARRLVGLPWVGLVNLLAERRAVPELLQDRATPSALAEAVRPLLDGDCHAVDRQREAFALVRGRLGSPGAGRRVAALALESVA